MSDRSGEQFGPYQLLELLGRGGMGEVYRARDTGKDRIVAVKLLPPHLASNADYERRFEREARAAGSVTDPHVVPIHNYGRLDGVLFLEMPYVVGTDLRQVIKAGGPLEVERAVHIVEQIASALDAAHAAGLTHRDVKPENVLITDHDFCYLADFGIASRAEDTLLTASGVAVGSMRYMAPERFADRPATSATDTYALGCIAYELLTGRQAFAARTAESITREQLNDYPPPPPDTVPAGMANALRQAIDKDPTNRQASSGEFARQLRAAVPAPVVTKKWTRWHWVAAATVIALAVAAGTAFGMSVFGDQEPQAVILMPADKTSPDAFTESVARSKPSDTVQEKHVRRDGRSQTASGSTPTAAAALASPQEEAGSTSGLYGVPANGQSACDSAALVSMIAKDEKRAKVWADLIGTTPGKIGETVADLTPLILRADTLVVNSDYKNGKAVQYPAVLQAGTAVLVDQFGMPKVKCNCGNPLASAPKELPTMVSGEPWQTWSGKATKVTGASSKVKAFTVTNVGTGASQQQKVGSDVGASTGEVDAIKTFDFGNTTWSIDGLDGASGPERVALRDGKYTKPGGGEEPMTWEWIRPGGPGLGEMPPDRDLNRDGHSDSIQVVRFKGRYDFYVVWLWDPRRKVAVQAGQIAAPDGCSTLERITTTANRIVVENSVQGGDCPSTNGSPSGTSVFVIKDGKTVFVDGGGGKESPPTDAPSATPSTPSGGGEVTPQLALQTYVRAWANGNYGAACSLIVEEGSETTVRTDEDRSACTTFLALARGGVSPEQASAWKTARVSGAMVTGERAVVTADQTSPGVLEEGDPATLRRIEGKWYVEVKLSDS